MPQFVHLHVHTQYSILDGQASIQRLNEEADTARRYLDLCELEVLEPQYSDNFVLKLLYEILNKKTSQRVRLPEGVFDMTTAVHGIYEE